MAKLNIINGTPVNHHRHGICGTCVHSHITKDVNGTESVTCDEGRDRVVTRHPIIECSDYHNKSETSLFEYKQIAWIITVDAKANKIGFEKPKTEDYRDY